MKLKHLIRPDLQTFQPYGSARRQEAEGHLWLNANESPWNKSLPEHPNILLNRYPDPQPFRLLEKLAQFYQTQVQNILITRGSDEAIDLLIRLFCAAGKDSIMICPPTFGMYEICARLQGAFTIFVPLNKATGFQLDLPAIKKSWHPQVKLIFLRSPNNPTGHLLNESDVLDLCETFSEKSLVIVDEAYIEYTHRNSLIQKMAAYENLVILRTFSKALGLAAIRCGSLIAHETIIQWLDKITMPYPISALTEHLAYQTLEENNLKESLSRISIVQSENKRLFDYFSSHPAIVHVWPSEGNFLLIETTHASFFMDSCLKKGIVLRQIPDQYGLKNAIRISIGLPQENTYLIETLENIKYELRP